MKTLKEYNQQELQELTDTHNSLVKPLYRCEVAGFKNWINDYDFDMTDIHPIVEIPSYLPHPLLCLQAMPQVLLQIF
jgi:hypothetical protein